MKAQMAIAILFSILSSCTPATSPLSTRAPSPTYVFTSTPTTTSATMTPVLETGLPPSPTITPNPTQAKQQQDIKNVIHAYFDLRYRLLSVSPSADIQQGVFGGLVSDGENAKDFLMTETAKLAVERKWHELNKQRYAKYEYSLKYENIVVDTSAQTTVVSLAEFFEIVCERAMENSPQNPSSCATGALSHEITLRNEQGQWKIISDIYWDSWWYTFRKPGLTTGEILHSINLEMQKLEAISSPTPWLRFEYHKEK